MRKALFTLALLASAFTLPLTAHADTIDDFVLTDPIGDTITFSLPASTPVFGPSEPGQFETFPVLMSFNPPYFGSEFLDGQLIFYSTLAGGGLEVMFFHPGGTTRFTDHGDLLYAGTTADPTFLNGIFNVETDTLTITPETGPVPEPYPLVLLATGVLGVLCLGTFSHSKFPPLDEQE